MAPNNSPRTGKVLPVSQLKTAKDLTRKLESLRSARSILETQWKINLAFYQGKQYIYRNPINSRIESLPVEEGEKPRYRVRLVSNQIMAGAQSLLSKYTKTKPVITATPGSGSDHDLKAAQMAERLLEYWWDDFRLDDALGEALMWSIIAGNGYWKISWDEHAGKQMRFMLDPSGQPILDEALKDAYRAELERMGLPPQEQMVYLGDIRVEAFSPLDVYIDPAAKTFGEAKYAICVHHMDPDEIKTRWGVQVDPDSVPAQPFVALPFANAEDAADKTVKRVYIGYFSPSAALPNGRYVVWIEKPDQILQDDPWPYPTNDLPIVQFPGLRNPGSIYDEAVVTHAIPLQKELNKTISQIVEYKNLTIRPRVWAPVGSLRQRLTSEPGNVYEYQPIAGLKPEVEELPSLPPYVFEHLNNIAVRLNDMFALTEVGEGKLPPNLEAGVAIDLLQEMSTDRMAPTIKLIETALARAGQLMLSLAQKYYIEPRLLKIKGSGGSVQVKRFSQADIDGGVAIHVESGSGLPRTRAGRQARIQSYVDMGVLPPQKAWKYLDVADLKGLAAEFASDEDHAYREIDKMMRGEPLNPEAAQQAMLAVMQGLNPETLEPLESQEEAMAVVERASLQPGLADNNEIHWDVLRKFINSVEFESLPMDIRQRVLIHAQLTMDAISKLPQPEPQAPRTTLQIKATTGPTGVSKILQSGGVDMSPEEAAEPPVETWVSDKIDEPDADAAGNDPLTQQELQLYELKLADKKELQEEQKLRGEKAKADLHEKKLKQSDFRPKPKPTSVRKRV